MLTGEKIGAWAITEPGAGSDAFGGMTTVARRVDGGYVLRGQKTFISNAPYADVLVVYAKMDTATGPFGSAPSTPSCSSAAPRGSRSASR